MMSTLSWNMSSQTLKSIDSLWAGEIPPLDVPSKYLGPAAPPLPFTVDNSSLPYFRPIFNQAALECGQAAGVGYNFTYEIDRLRNLPANVIQNQYPTHWVWNFSNNGNNAGIAFFESWDIIRRMGTPNVQEWGGTMSFGGQYRWISGYDTYYSAMKNRLKGVYGINVSDTTGINILKHWIHDHLDSSATGGVASFYAQYMSSPTQIPPGVYEAGKHVITYWGSSPNHAMTIVGYNDSVRWDYNNDGLYTNDIDITGDGIVDLADWEIGAFKLANSYGGVPAWGDNGFCYFMYRTLASPIGQGGIWNQTVYVVEAVHDYEPLLAMKVKIKHPSRQAIRIAVGINADTLAGSPAFEMDYPAFRFQGGNRYMQGGTTEADKTIEIGFDITPLLSYIPPGKAAFYLIIDEHDLSGNYPGEVISCSLMDYTSSTVQEIPYPYSNIPILNNLKTVIPLVHELNFSAPVITDSILPPVITGSDYEYQLSASQGLPPYEWSFMHDYSITESNTAFPATGGLSLGFSNSTSGYATVPLGFSFPFMGEWFDTIYVHVDGYITFDKELHPWPYLTDEMSYMRGTRCIAPFMYKGYTNYSSANDGMWKTVQPDGMLIRWETSLDGSSTNSDARFAVKLCHDGTLHFYYGLVSFPWMLYPVIGLSAGNSFDFITLPIQGVMPVINGTHYELNPTVCQSPATLSKKGMLRTPSNGILPDCPLHVKVTDHNGISTTKMLNLSQKGVLASLSMMSGGDSILHAGETAQVNLSLLNIGDSALINISCSLQVLSANATALDDSESIPSIEPDSTVINNGAFTLKIDSLVLDHEPLSLGLTIMQGGDTFQFHFDFELRSTALEVGKVIIADGNDNNFCPGETAAMIVELKNTGGLPIQNIRTRIFTWDPYIQILSDSALIPFIGTDTSGNAFYIVSCSASAPLGHMVVFRLELDADQGFIDTLHFFLVLGDQVETFETADFTQFSWQFSGDEPWHIDSLTPFSGQYCAQSGDITDNENSNLYLTLDVLSDDFISFYRKVDCEADNTNHNYDYLSFSIDGMEIERWDGNKAWAQVQYPVSKGIHTFKWNYHKDYSVSTGADCAWIDEVDMPVFGVIPPLDIDLVDKPDGLFVNAFPNPSNGNVTLFVRPEIAGRIRIDIYDIQGQKLVSINERFQQANQDCLIPLDLRHFNTSGLFMVQVIDDEGHRAIKKLIVNKE